MTIAKQKASKGKKLGVKKRVTTIPQPSDTKKADAMAIMATRASVHAAAVMVEYTEPLGEQNIGALVWPYQTRWMTFGPAA